MVHERKMKLLVYISTGYFERSDPDFRPQWARRPDLVELWYHYAGCSPLSPGWRSYLLPRIIRILDDYEIDGLYDDLGQRPLYNPRITPAEDEIAAFRETEELDGALEDLLGLVYGEVKKRGGIFKVHSGGASAPKTPTKLYDYLWVGEAVKNADSMRETVKHHAPYVISCLDLSRAKIYSEDELYLHTIPYMQFPLFLTGRPFTGERAVISGIEYQPEEKDFWTRHCRNIWRYYQSHPNGPYSYGWWDSCPGRKEAKSTYFHWLSLYRPMVTEGTWAYLEVTESDLFTNPLPENIVGSVFANEKLHLVLANYSNQEIRVRTKDRFSRVGGPSDKADDSWLLQPRRLVLLNREV
jgi:hypothetical protein